MVSRIARHAIMGRQPNKVSHLHERFFEDQGDTEPRRTAGVMVDRVSSHEQQESTGSKLSRLPAERSAKERTWPRQPPALLLPNEHLNSSERPPIRADKCSVSRATHGEQDLAASDLRADSLAAPPFHPHESLCEN